MKSLLKKKKNTHRNYIYNYPKLETIRAPFNSRMDKQIVVSSYNGLLRSNKKEQTTDTQVA